jgi:lipopolysaccharide biosynthesis glycosyltransferase
MNYLYILVSDETDLYYEQALVSLTSLRLRMPDAHVILLTDTRTRETFTNVRSCIERLATEVVGVDLPHNLSNKERSRWLKTSMREYVTGDFLFIDCDTVITENLNGIARFTLDLGAVLDTHITLDLRFKNSGYKERHIGRDKQLGFTTPEREYFNSGVILCRDTPATHAFFAEWHRLWKESVKQGVIEDQPSFSQANLNCRRLIQKIPGVWNCQLVRWGMPFLWDAKIIHYYNAAANKKPYIFANTPVYEKIKAAGGIPPKYLALLKYPKAAFGIGKRDGSGGTFYDILKMFFYPNRFCAVLLKPLKWLIVKTLVL